MTSVTVEVRAVRREVLHAVPPDSGAVDVYGPPLREVELGSLPLRGDLVQVGPDLARVVEVLHRTREWTASPDDGVRRQRAAFVLLCFWHHPRRRGGPEGSP